MRTLLVISAVIVAISGAVAGAYSYSKNRSTNSGIAQAPAINVTKTTPRPSAAPTAVALESPNPSPTPSPTTAVEATPTATATATSKPKATPTPTKKTTTNTKVTPGVTLTSATGCNVGLKALTGSDREAFLASGTLPSGHDVERGKNFLLPETSNTSTDLLLIVDSAKHVCLMSYLFAVDAGSALTVDATSTATVVAYAELTDLPIIDVQKRVTKIQALSSFPALKNFLDTQLRSVSMTELSSNTTYRSLVTATASEYETKYPDDL